MAATGRLARQPSAVPSRSFVARPALRLSQVARRADKQVVRAEEGSVDVDQVVKDLQEKWDRVENKTTVVLYGAGALVALWFSSTLVTALNSIPVLPKALELVGLGYTAWFTYRYLLFKSSREELKKEVEELKKKVAGNDL
jgi:hypothetical protein